jgi:hypothetical protein
MDLEAALRDTEAALAAARDRLRSATEEVEALETEQRGLMLAVARHRGVAAPSVVPDSEQERWKDMTRAVAVETMLGRQNEPIGPADLARLLVAAGRTNDTASYVAATLDYLKRRNRVTRVGYGQWILVERLEDDQSSVFPDEEADKDAQPNGSKPATLTGVRRGPSAGFPGA